MQDQESDWLESEIRACVAHRTATYAQRLERSLHWIHENGLSVPFLRHKWTRGGCEGKQSLEMETIGSIEGRSGYFSLTDSYQVLSWMYCDEAPQVVCEGAGRFMDAISLLKLPGIKEYPTGQLNGVKLCESCSDSLSITSWTSKDWMCDSCQKEKSGYVYVLSNPALESLKIGYTGRGAEKRASDLSKSTSIPTEFTVEHQTATMAPKRVEREVHDQLDGYRVSDNAEFFDCGLSVATSSIEAVASDVAQELGFTDAQALTQEVS